jgi:flagellin-like protein
MLFTNKRGVSPLIATILLISFAVSLGAVIMNLGVNMSTTVCEDVLIEPLVVANQPRFCLSNSTVTFAVSNMGPDIAGAKVIAIGDVVVEKDFLEFTSYHNILGKSFDVNQNTLDAVQVTPIIYDTDGELAYCPSKQIEIIDLKKC